MIFSWTCREGWQNQLKDLISKLNISVAFDCIAGDMSGTMMQVNQWFHSINIKIIVDILSDQCHHVCHNYSASPWWKHHHLLWRPVRRNGDCFFLHCISVVFVVYFKCSFVIAHCISLCTWLFQQSGVLLVISMCETIVNIDHNWVIVTMTLNSTTKVNGLPVVEMIYGTKKFEAFYLKSWLTEGGMLRTILRWTT